MLPSQSSIRFRRLISTNWCSFEFSCYDGVWTEIPWWRRTLHMRERQGLLFEKLLYVQTWPGRRIMLFDLTRIHCVCWSIFKYVQWLGPEIFKFLKPRRAMSTFGYAVLTAMAGSQGALLRTQTLCYKLGPFNLFLSPCFMFFNHFQSTRREHFVHGKFFRAHVSPCRCNLDGNEAGARVEVGFFFSKSFCLAST